MLAPSLIDFEETSSGDIPSFTGGVFLSNSNSPSSEVGPVPAVPTVPPRQLLSQTEGNFPSSGFKMPTEQIVVNIGQADQATSRHGRLSLLAVLKFTLPVVVLLVIIFAILFFIFHSDDEIVADPVVVPEPFPERNGTALAAQEGIMVDPFGGLPMFH